MFSFSPDNGIFDRPSSVNLSVVFGELNLFVGVAGMFFLPYPCLYLPPVSPSQMSSH